MKLKEYKYKINGTKFTVGIGEIENNKVHVEVNGAPYTVELDETQAPKAAAVAAAMAVKRPQAAPRTETGEKVIAAPVQAAGSPDAIKAPLPGTVMSIAVKEGDNISSGQTVCVLEAMKMENEIRSTKSGVVQKICVAPGDAILEGADIMIVC